MCHYDTCLYDSLDSIGESTESAAYLGRFSSLHCGEDLRDSTAETNERLRWNQQVAVMVDVIADGSTVAPTASRIVIELVEVGERHMH